LTHVVLYLTGILVLRMLTLTPVIVLATTSATASIASVIAHASAPEVTSFVPAHLVVHVPSGLLLAIISLVAEIFTAFFHDKTD
jgi:hypothetical protein